MLSVSVTLGEMDGAEELAKTERDAFHSVIIRVLDDTERMEGY